MSILVLTSDTLIGTAAAGNLEYNGQFFGTDSNASRAQLQRIVRATAVASTSGTSIDFTSLPSWVKRITVMFNETSLSNTDNLLIQLGTGSTTYTTSGYVSTSNAYSNASATSGISSTTGFAVTIASTAANSASGTLTLININGNTWVSSHTHKIGTTTVGSGGGSVTLGAVLTAVRITSTGTATFDAGSINILYEG